MKNTGKTTFISSTCFLFLLSNSIKISSSHPHPYKPKDGQEYNKYSKNQVPFRTTWPLQIGFPGAKIPNLNSYLDLFSNCLVNVQNFHGIDLLEWNFPIHLTRFDIAGTYNYTTDNKFFSMSLRFLFEKVPSLKDLKDTGTWQVLELISDQDSLKFKWTCLAQFDLFHPEIKDAFHFYLHRMAYSNIENFVLGPSLSRYHVNPYYKYVVPKVFGDHTRPTYFLLVTHLNTSLETKDFWLYGKTELLLNEHTSRLFYLFTQNFVEIKNFSGMSQELSILSFNFVCFTCCTCKKVVIPLHLDSWEEVVFSLSIPGRVPWIVHDYFSLVDENVPSSSMNGFLFKIDDKNSFRQFLASQNQLRNLPDKFIASYILPNASFISEEFAKTLPSKPESCLRFPEHLIENFTAYDRYKTPGEHICFFPQLELRSTVRMALVRNQDEFTFLSCGTPQREKVSIAGLFSSFDKATWGCMVAFIFIWPVTLSLIENNFNFRLVLIDSQTWLLGLILLLEQGHYLATNSNKRGPLYYTCGLTLLVLIVVSNAYKGDNIQALTKLLQVIPYTNFQELLNGGMKLLSQTVIKIPDVLTYMFDNITEFDEIVESLGWQIPQKKIDEVRNGLSLHPLGARIFLHSTAVASYSVIMDECKDAWLCLGGSWTFFGRFPRLSTKIKITMGRSF